MVVGSVVVVSPFTPTQIRGLRFCTWSLALDLAVFLLGVMCSVSAFNLFLFSVSDSGEFRWQGFVFLVC